MVERFDGYRSAMSTLLLTAAALDVNAAAGEPDATWAVHCLVDASDAAHELGVRFTPQGDLLESSLTELRAMSALALPPGAFRPRFRLAERRVRDLIRRVTSEVNESERRVLELDAFMSDPPPDDLAD